MPTAIRICLYTIADQVRQKSFFVLLAVCIVFVMMLRGCYKGSYVVNGQGVDSATVAWHASRVAFHLIASGAVLIAALLSMGAFRRDRDEGVLGMTLCRPVARWEYAAGKIAGVWLLCFAIMFVLHLTIFFTAWFSSGGMIPGYLPASAVCGLNVLFMTATVCLLSLLLPDVIAAIAALGIWAVSFGSDSFYRIAHSDLVRTGVQQALDTSPSLWRIVWPKLTAVQYFASSIIGGEDFAVMGPLHPAINVALWTAAAIALVILRFQRGDEAG